MKVKEVMTSPVVTVRSQTPAKDAAQTLVVGGFTTLPVVDDNRLLGLDLLHDRFAPDTRMRRHVREVQADRLHARGSPDRCSPTRTLTRAARAPRRAPSPWFSGRGSG
jgi:CBS domain-containing protein